MTVQSWFFKFSFTGMLESEDEAAGGALLAPLPPTGGRFTATAELAAGAAQLPLSKREGECTQTQAMKIPLQ